MQCPYCDEEINPVDHNNRGLRCPKCWERVPEPEQVEEAPKVAEEPKVAEAPKPKPVAKSRSKRQ